MNGGAIDVRDVRDQAPPLYSCNVEKDCMGSLGTRLHSHMRDFDLRAGPHHREFRMHVAIFGDTIINARRMRTMVTVLSVCVLAPVCWLHIKSIQHIQRSNRLFARFNCQILN